MSIQPLPPGDGRDRRLRKRPVAITLLATAGAALGALIDAGILHGELVLTAHALLTALFG